MSSKMHRHGKKTSNNLSVTSRCVAILFKPAESDDKGIDSQVSAGDENHVDLHENDREAEEQFNPQETGPLPPCKRGSGFDPRRVFEDFKMRNKTCYWNPALVDSVKNLEYVGFLEPHTVLVRGGDIHLENIRTAWGRRVLKDPAEFVIQRIGDINGIEMQVIPQTQFIPLPESLCLIIMELNNNQIVATLDTIYERLQHCYQGLHLPSNQLVYDTLGQLIRERKVFHTGCGYFVVTPDTFRFNGTDMSPGSMMSPWTHLHPMYIPAAFSQPPKQATRSISCQVDGEESMLGGHRMNEKATLDHHTGSETVQVDMPSPRLQRSHSVSARQSRARGRREETYQDSTLRRSSSVKGRSEKGKSLSKPVDQKMEARDEKHKEKVSLFTKIFGRSKKKAAPVAEPIKKPVVEYATFSAQFPPPEWMWYQQQLDKHVRTETWVQQQMVKSGTWHYLQNMSDVGVGAGGSGGAGSAHFSLTSMPERTSEPSPLSRQNPHHNFLGSMPGARKSHRKSHKHKDRSPVVIANHQGGTANIDMDDKHTYRNSMGQKNIRLSSLPMPNQGGEVLHSNYVSHPMFSSTPRFSGVPQSRIHVDTKSKNYPEPQVKPVDSRDKYAKVNKGQGQRKFHKSKKKSHHDRHSSYVPDSRHVSGMSSHPHQSNFVGVEDISVEYHGRLQNKNSSLAISQNSGVNCVGLESGSVLQTRGPGYQRSRSYRHTVIETGGPRGNTKDDVSDAHIYANVHVTSPTDEIKPKIPERTHRKGHGRKSEVKSPSVADVPVDSQNQEQTDNKNNRLCVELHDLDRRSDHNSDQGTVNSLSSHEQSSQDSALDGTMSSEHSLGTVINTRVVVNRHLDRLISETQELTLGDSGFSSPRVSENSSDCAKKGDCNLPKEPSGFMCNNLKSEPFLNNSMGKLNESSDDSYGRITSDTLYENVKINHHKEVLNNMKYLHKEITVSSQNLNVQEGMSESFTPGTTTTDFDPKQSVVKKFNFEGDFHVVGVV